MRCSDDLPPLRLGLSGRARHRGAGGPRRLSRGRVPSSRGPASPVVRLVPHDDPPARRPRARQHRGPGGPASPARARRIAASLGPQLLGPRPRRRPGADDTQAVHGLPRGRLPGLHRARLVPERREEAHEVAQGDADRHRSRGSSPGCGRLAGWRSGATHLGRCWRALSRWSFGGSRRGAWSSRSCSTSGRAGGRRSTSSSSPGRAASWASRSRPPPRSAPATSVGSRRLPMSPAATSIAGSSSTPGTRWFRSGQAARRPRSRPVGLAGLTAG